MASTAEVGAIIGEAEQRYKKQGARLTVKRKQMLSGLLHSDTALSAYDLVELCREQYGYAIPAMSVYRILDFLQSQQLVHKLQLANTYVACADIGCNHAHCVPQFPICGRCQRVEEVRIASATIQALSASVEAADFELVSPQIEMNCICKDCVSEPI